MTVGAAGGAGGGATTAAGDGAVTISPHFGQLSLCPAISGGTASRAPQEWQENLSKRGFVATGDGIPDTPTIMKTYTIKHGLARELRRYVS